MKENIEIAEISIDNLANCWSSLAPEQKKEIPISWKIKAWENSNQEFRAQMEEELQREARNFYKALIILRNISPDSELFYKVLSWTKARANNNFVMKIFLKYFLIEGLRFNASF